MKALQKFYLLLASLAGADKLNPQLNKKQAI